MRNHINSEKTNIHIEFLDFYIYIYFRTIYKIL
jgi:hypothetical protein